MTHGNIDIKNYNNIEIDPNALQGKASNPENSSWVNASAGSGKTKVLTDRILRILLPKENGQNGSPPHKILALTFTKAGASEMELRIQKTLSSWATLDEEKLISDLKTLLERKPTDIDIKSARQLFAKVIDAQSGLPIMTIHSFCQSILGRFPLEAGISPQYKALEEPQAQALLKKASSLITKKATQEKGSQLSDALIDISSEQNEEQFEEIFTQIIRERSQMTRILRNNFGSNGIYNNICKLLKIDPKDSIDSLYNEFIKNLDTTKLYRAIEILSASKSIKDNNISLSIKLWIESENKIINFEEYKKIFLTSKNELRKKITTKKINDNHPDIEKILKNESLRILTLEEKIKSIKCATLTRDILTISEYLLSTYELLKSEESSLDFDDLILKTLDLLNGKSTNITTRSITPWIRFKLDQGIDHILIDEAQDTNPEQWEIIKALCDDFFDGEGAQESNRTIFVVGDEKQSIFSFQRASPEKFIEIKNFFKEKINNSNNKFEPVNIDISFRTVRSILECVDSVFKTLPLHNIKNKTNHKSYRKGQAGLVELWPIFKTEKEKNTNYWQPPIEIKNSQSGASKIAEHIGNTIKSWIDNKEILEPYNRPINAGDIMILMRTRTPFIDQLVRELKTREIPVSGVDRIVLKDQLVIQDLCSAANFGLLPEDDLNLACLLKSPFLNLNDEYLEKIAIDRSGSLWESLKKDNKQNVIDWLSNLIIISNKKSPFEFFTYLLQNPCPADKINGLVALKQRLGNEILDPIDEFLNSAILYEQENSPSLQRFLHHHYNVNSDIKREMEETNNAVRIMTVHGSKGLQSPIVILPDTIHQSPNKINKMIWPNQSNQPLPLFSPRKKDAPEIYLKAQNDLKIQLEQEYRRLLYVAMTRAENRLYVGGYTNKKEPNNESWYYYIKDSFKQLNGIENLENGSIRYSCHQSNAPDKKENNSNELKINQHNMPKWLHKKIPDEPNPPKPIIPSRPSANEVISTSPLIGDNNYRFKRGNITHMLLQMLPDTDPKKWKKTAKLYLNKTAHDLSTEIKNSIITETMNILNHHEFAPIFSKGSIAEVPITGILDDNTLISGQIDRLLITEEYILIIDYKTNRPSPKLEEDMPLIYKKQMKSYADILAKIYPEKEIKTALLWTDGPYLMPVTKF